MISPTLLALAIALLLAGLALLEAAGWRAADARLRRYSAPVAWLAAGLILLYLIWLGVERRHIPPAGPDEALAVYAWLGLLGFLWLRSDSRAGIGLMSLGLVGLTLVFGAGLGFPRRDPIYLGQEPLWPGIVSARWLILAGLAGLYWLALLAALSWWSEKRPHLRETLRLPPEPAAVLTQRLQPLVTLLLFFGGLLLSLSAPFVAGNPANPGLLAMALFLLTLAAGWLRFTAPYRRWWAWALTIFTFIASLPLLTLMAA